MKTKQIKDKKKLSLNIDIQTYFLDHKFENKPVLPAVEAMQILAQEILPYLEDKSIISISNASFDRFLSIPLNKKNIPVFVDIDFCEIGCIKSTLMTQTLSGKMKIRRMKEHVSLEFLTRDKIEESFQIPAISGEYFEIPAQRIYKELVTFGPAYHNIKENLKIRENRIEAFVYAGNFTSHYSLSGSPFPLDAAFHAACVWGQRYANVVAFPLGFNKRQIINPTKPGNTYSARIRPVQKKLPLLIFDMEIYTLEGTLCEIISGVRMRDVSAGRLKPPEWIVNNFAG